MCGIAGFVGGNATPQEARATLEAMIHRLSHRGPDGYGYHIDAGAGLAHARLAIIDLTTGDQPIRNGRGTVWTVFNGEIFNYIELRDELEARGHRFYTHSDTEVITHLYDEYGDRFVDHLNGQFAIALWDSERRRLLLVRDRAGIRPLFHARAGGRVWFGSEIKAVLGGMAGRPQLDPSGIVQALTYWSPADPDTAFAGVRSLPPGHAMAIEADGSEHTWQYWDWTFPTEEVQRREAHWHDTGAIDRAAEELRELLVDAVRIQLRADVPVGAYLSGGLDSSGIVALIRGFTDTPMRTFSVAFEDAEFDESEHQMAMVRHLRTDHTMVRVTRRDIGDAFPRLVRHAEAPVIRTAPAPLMLLSQRVRQEGYKVVLTGEGADEVFGGYDLFKEAKVRRFWARQPDSRMRPKLLGRLYGYLKTSPVGNEAFAQSFFGQGMEHIGRPVFAHVPRWTTSQRARSLLAPDVRAALGDWDPLAFYERKLPAAIGGWTPLARDQYVEAKSLLAGYLLSAQGDRMGMANSVEGRFPYLDHRLIEFASRLPPSFKIRGLTEKFLLRRALAGLLPEDVLHRVKQPYRAPDSQSFFFDGKPLDYVAELMGADRIRSAGWFEPAAVARLFEKCRSGRAIGFADNQAFVGVLSTMLLDAQFVRGETFP
jgi:asparagine synthase (glutamine-hydrolysing)